MVVHHKQGARFAVDQFYTAWQAGSSRTGDEKRSSMVATRRAEVNPAEDGRGREPGEPNDDGASIEQSKDDDHDPTLEGLTEEGKRLILETRRMKRVGIKKGGDSDIDKALKKFPLILAPRPPLSPPPLAPYASIL